MRAAPRSPATSRATCPSPCTGSKLSGGFGLTRTGERRWILVKVRDEHARPGSDIVAEQPASVRSGLTWQRTDQRAAPGSGR